MNKNLFLVGLILLTFSSIRGQYQSQSHSGEIYENLEKFNFLGSVLYVAAHPDDENTRLISYLSKGLNARTAYLSITRGDGGQNLIGTEIGELLGVIRSQELQMARTVDGGMQFFTRANDFGFSKHPDETLEIWNKDEVLQDIVQAIRSFKPDIIINRFDHRSAGSTHGHHTSSAVLALEAYELAQDKNKYPSQIANYGTWKATRLFFNTSWWFYGSREKFAEADKSRLVPVDVGVYFPTIGLSNNEISALARSKHRSQGFGSAGDRGNYQEYLELLEGEMPKDKSNLFDGLDTSWSRVEGGEIIKQIMADVMEKFDFRNPSNIVPDLLNIHSQLTSLKDSHWKRIKLVELNDLIINCLGLYIEASTDEQHYTLLDTVEIAIEWTNRSRVNVSAESITINGITTEINSILEPYTTVKEYQQFPIDQQTPFTNPYWLDKEKELGMYKVSEPSLRNLPESPAPIICEFILNIEGHTINSKRALNYRYVNPAEGEIREPISILPPATISFDKELYLLSSESEQIIKLKIRASREYVSGKLKLEVPPHWKVIPDSMDFSINNKGAEETFSFVLVSPDKISESQINAMLEIDDKIYNKTLTTIDYDHIPFQTILSTAKSKIVKVPLQISGNKIAYLMGAGDRVPESLSNIGYEVQLIETSDLQQLDLSQFDAIVIGIRAYNTLPELKLYKELLFGYAEEGGTLITQYNTSRRLNFDDLAPYTIKLSRKRVADENAEIRILSPNHKVLNYPNKISEKDFSNWVQERGLYFPEEWDERYVPILSSNDKGEESLDGSLLIAEYGEGYFVYTSLSWFRQLPAGVPGAFRLFSNILALSQKDNDRP